MGRRPEVLAPLQLGPDGLGLGRLGEPMEPVLPANEQLVQLELLARRAQVLVLQLGQQLQQELELPC